NSTPTQSLRRGGPKEWLEQACGVQLPDSDSLQADACGPGYRYDTLTRLVLESKEDMRRRGALSPDKWDAVALTFARPVQVSNFHRMLGYPNWAPVWSLPRPMRAPQSDCKPIDGGQHLDVDALAIVPDWPRQSCLRDADQASRNDQRECRNSFL